MTTVTADTDQAEAARVSFDRQALGLRTATPAIVVAVDPDGRWVDVQPAVSMTQRLESAVQLQMPVVKGVPLAVLGSTGLGLFVAVPVAIGDDGYLVIMDRALDNWQYGAGVNSPPDMQTPRHHDITDAIFVPGLQRMSGAIAAYPTDAVQVRNRAGDCVLSVSATEIHAVTPGGAAIDLAGGTVEITGTLVINGEPYLDHRHSPVDDGPPDHTGPVEV